MIEKKTYKIAIASGKGGTGKTLLSTNLASYLSKINKTLLVDLDVEEPNDFLFIKGNTESVSNQYKMIPEWNENKCTFCGICSSSCKYHAVIQLGKNIVVFKELCHSCFACSELCPEQALPMQKHKMGEIKKISSGKLTFIESRLEVREEQAVPLINQTHEMVNKTFGHIPLQIFDCPPGTSCPLVAASKEADFVILVTEPTPFGLNDLKLAVETMKELEKPIGVVINRYGLGNTEVEKYCARENINVIAKIPFSKRIAEHYSNGDLIYEFVDEFRQSLEQITSAIQEGVSV
jgi:MinD superfamily P-loop ATPase